MKRHVWWGSSATVSAPTHQCWPGGWWPVTRMRFWLSLPTIAVRLVSVGMPYFCRNWRERPCGLRVQTPFRFDRENDLPTTKSDLTLPRESQLGAFLRDRCSRGCAFHQSFSMWFALRHCWIFCPGPNSNNHKLTFVFCPKLGYLRPEFLAIHRNLHDDDTPARESRQF